MASSATISPLSEGSRGTGDDVLLVLGYTSWTGALRRSQIHPEDQLTVSLLQSPRVSRMLVCNPYRSVAAKLMRSDGDEGFPESGDRWLYEPTRLRRRDSTRFDAIERSCRRYERRIRNAAEERGLERPAVICAHPLIAGFCDFAWSGPVTYYANDDLTGYPPLAPWWPAFGESFARMRERGRRGVGLTPRSLKSIDPSGLGAVIPSGLIPSEWEAPGPAPDWFLELPGPRMVYVGTLDDRIDPEFVRALAEAYPEASIAMIGRGAENGPLTPLDAYPNVHLISPVRREELLAIVAAADLGLVPHVETEQTRAMSPLKLFEYLGAGIPVAATDLPGISPVAPSRVMLASSPPEFAAAAGDALALGRASEEDRRRFVEENSWDSRFEVLLDLALAAEKTHPKPRVEG